MVNPSDIRFHYSGGLDNSDPNLSIGGTMSKHLIPSNVFDNLWKPLPLKKIVSGYTRYRLIYVENLSVEPFLNIHMYTPVVDSPPNTTGKGFTDFEWSHLDAGHESQLLEDETETPSPTEIGEIFEEPQPWTKVGETFNETRAIVHAIPTKSFRGIWLRQIFPPNVDRTIHTQYHLTLGGGTQVSGGVDVVV